jgi:uncharacterized protein (TIGR02145 family)
MRKILLSLVIAFGMQAGAQTDTVMYRHFNNGTIDTASISTIDSITFGYVNQTSGGCSGGLTNITYNGYTYDLVEIGGQCWFKENLQTTMYRDSTPINYPGTDYTAWQNNTTGAYAWYNNDSSTYAPTYGALYNWYAVDNSAGLCPAGWHVPSDSAWTVLETYLVANGYSYQNGLYAKTIADSVGWNSSTGTGHIGNTDYPSYRNKSGFSGLGSGYYVGNGNYLYLGEVTYWYCSSLLYSTANPHFRSLNYDKVNLAGTGGTSTNKETGFSVRCLRD